jgi:uncharacterized membrane protein
MNLTQLNALGLAAPFDGIGPIVIWMLVIAVTVAVALALFPFSGSDHDRALDFLRRRLAAGEISEAEYDQARRILG